MRLIISIAIFALAGCALIACNSAERKTSTAPVVAKATPGTTTVYADGVRRITTVELKDLIDKGQAFVVDVRNEPSFNIGHIKGARLIPLGDILTRVKELPRDKTIVTYCSWPSEQTSAGAAVNLKTKGIVNTAALLGGFDAWKNAGLPVEHQ